MGLQKVAPHPTQEEEELSSIRPDLDGQQVMDLLALTPGPEVGRALRMLLEVRMEEGPLGEDEARRRVLAWWSEQQRPE